MFTDITEFELSLFLEKFTLICWGKYLFWISMPNTLWQYFLLFRDFGWWTSQIWTSKMGLAWNMSANQNLQSLSFSCKRLSHVYLFWTWPQERGTYMAVTICWSLSVTQEWVQYLFWGVGGSNDSRRLRPCVEAFLFTSFKRGKGICLRHPVSATVLTMSKMTTTVECLALVQLELQELFLVKKGLIKFHDKFTQWRVWTVVGFHT